MPDIRTVDYHTAGEPFRIVTSGAPDTPGATVGERRAYAASSREHEHLRTLLCHEPRGHAGMYGCLLVPPDDSGADLGALFWHADGWSTACGHGTIALGRWALDSGLVTGRENGTARVVVDVPSGRVTATVSTSDGRASSVRFGNVASYVLAREVPVRTDVGDVAVDLAYGGAVYACVPAARLGLSVDTASTARLVAAGRQVKRSLHGSPATEHPSDPRLSGVYGTILYDDLGDTDHGPHQRNVTVFADGQVDRSPCGSGTCARLALLHAEGRVGTGRVLTHDSILGTRFRAGVERVTREAGRPAVVPWVEGTAFRTGEHRFVLDPADDLATGFLL